MEYTFRHKLEVLKVAMEEHGYDEVVLLDWDTRLLVPLPSDFWEVCRQKAEIQAPLYRFNHTVCPWRGDGHSRRVVHYYHIKLILPY
jgi:hypothetical protein